MRNFLIGVVTTIVLVVAIENRGVIAGKTVVHRVDGVTKYKPDPKGWDAIEGVDPRTKEVYSIPFMYIKIFKDVPQGNRGWVTWKENNWQCWDKEVHLPED